ncbi:MAG: hypothetical protein ACOC1I_02010, partial [Spirochaetota bacterium]
MRRLIAFIMVLYAAACAWSEVSFSGLDLAASDELVFSATADAPGFGSYRTLFHADLSAVADEAPASGVAGGDVLDRAELRQLTFFPEIMTYLPALQAVQIQNRFGVFRASISGGVFEPVGGFDSFVAGAAVETGRVFPVTASPDGRYLASSSYQGLSNQPWAFRVTDIATGAEILATEFPPGPSFDWASEESLLIGMLRLDASGPAFNFIRLDLQGGRTAVPTGPDVSPGMHV